MIEIPVHDGDPRPDPNAFAVERHPKSTAATQNIPNISSNKVLELLMLSATDTNATAWTVAIVSCDKVGVGKRST